ncbi:uncharacterized protein LOC143868820 [Tasmannia lanceolata]|uniref:uncharacterized protein LOC143868820 n=1 Tax=Tasmannia lanceolata TaxID=3420 RepID=UPI0040649C84
MNHGSSALSVMDGYRQEQELFTYHPKITVQPSNQLSIREIYDDRQGMNDGEPQFTKGEKKIRYSIDGGSSSTSNMIGGRKPTSGGASTSGGGGARKGRSRKGRSEARRSQQKGKFLCLNPRWNFMKRHESIATLQLSMLNSSFILCRTLDRDLQSFLPKERMSIKDFEQRYKLMCKYEVLSQIEYRFASKYETYVCRYATQEINQPKNNYKKCIPYDYNRVVLKTLPDTQGSDYINASYVDSCLKPNAYIAAQGPNEFTMNDFWRMIWEQKTFVIVMLTKVFDFIRVMCNQYWPGELNKSQRYGNFEVTLLYEEPLADFVIRTIKLTKWKSTDNSANERIIYQFHYNGWASHTCPSISSLLHFRRRVHICMDEMSKSGKTGPTIVHCNDGCGRTGAYLCIDANLELAEEDNVVDVFNYTKKMRQSRKFLIENFEQYKFVYETIEEALYCGKTWFPVTELHSQLKRKSRRNPLTKKNEYLKEYEKITRMTSKFSIGDCAGGHRVENREKNRDVSTVPPDNFRPYLTSFQTNDSTDYLNAVFVDGYTRSKEYIVTEWPLHKTISDFWSLVYDHDCNSVILLANPSESSTYPSFLPSEKELRRKFGPVFSAEMVSYTHYQNIKSWIYTINKKIVSLTEVMAGVKSEAKTTQVFQITCWPQGHRVPTSTNALVELMNMVERWRQRTTYGPVCVVSLNGKSRAGVYCAANVAIEQVVQHNEVDVFQAVKTVRRHRPQLIENMTEYKYCYDLILHYVLHYLNQNSPTPAAAAAAAT